MLGRVGGKFRGKSHLEDLGVDGKIILKFIFMTWDAEAQTGMFCLSVGTGTCKCDNVRSGSIKCGKFLY
jgi:hypothetical protein